MLGEQQTVEVVVEVPKSIVRSARSRAIRDGNLDDLESYLIEYLDFDIEFRLPEGMEYAEGDTCRC